MGCGWSVCLPGAPGGSEPVLRPRGRSAPAGHGGCRPSAQTRRVGTAAARHVAGTPLSSLAENYENYLNFSDLKCPVTKFSFIGRWVRRAALPRPLFHRREVAPGYCTEGAGPRSSQDLCPASLPLPPPSPFSGCWAPHWGESRGQTRCCSPCPAARGWQRRGLARPAWKRVRGHSRFRSREGRDVAPLGGRPVPLPHDPDGGRGGWARTGMAAVQLLPSARCAGPVPTEPRAVPGPGGTALEFGAGRALGAGLRVSRGGGRLARWDLVVVAEGARSHERQLRPAGSVKSLAVTELGDADRLCSGTFCGHVLGAGVCDGQLPGSRLRGSPPAVALGCWHQRGPRTVTPSRPPPRCSRSPAAHLGTRVQGEARREAWGRRTTTSLSSPPALERPREQPPPLAPSARLGGRLGGLLVTPRVHGSETEAWDAGRGRQGEQKSTPR